MKNDKSLKQMLSQAFKEILNTEDFKTSISADSKDIAQKVNTINNKFDYIIKKIDDLDSRILELTTAHEELMHMIDSYDEQLEIEKDNPADMTLNLEENKFKFN